MSVLAWDTDGRWKTVLEAGATPPEVFRDLIGDDIAPLFEIEDPRPVLSVAPPLPGRPDAICTTADGRIVAVLGIGGQSPDAVRDRLVEVVDGLRGRSLVDLMSIAPRIGLQHTPGSWTVSRTGHGDAVHIDRAIEERLAAGAIELVVAACAGAEHVALPIAELRAIREVEVRCFEVLYLAAGTVRLVEAYELPAARLDAMARTAERRASAEHMRRAAGSALGASMAPLVDALLGYCDAFFGAVTYRSIGEHVIVEAWLDQPRTGSPALRLDSSGAVVVHLADLETWDRQFLLQGIRAMVDERCWEEASARPLELRLSLHRDLADVSLVEQFVGAVSDAFLATMGNALVAPIARRQAA